MNAVKVPATVQGILAARIDRLPSDAKDLLQTLSVIGREFSLSLIRAVVTKSDDELSRLLNDLQLGEFIYEQPAVGDTEYIFKHALTQEVAYGSVLIERRRQLHERAGEGIEALFAEQLDDHLGELARHYSRGVNIAKAVRYLYLAGEQAAQRSAYAEAVGHHTIGLELLRRLPDDPERARRELELQLSLADSLRWTKGLGSSESGRALARAREVCTLMGDSTELFAVLMGLQSQHVMTLHLETARDLGEQLLSLAEKANEPDKLMGAHGALGVVCLLSGEFTAACDHFRQTSPRFVWGHSDFIVFYPCMGAWAIWALGYADQALEWSREALALAQALPRPAQFANALSLTAILHMFLRDPRMAQERAEATIALANEHGLALELSYGTFERGWALFEQGHLKEGTAEMHRATTTFAATGVGARPRWFAFLAEARARREGPEVGLEVIAEGMALMKGSGERMNEAELHRIKGELLLMHDAENAPEAEHCFRTAIQVARRQGGKFFELRATTSLARLLAKRGCRNEARMMLAEIYGWFTEGFDTADLKDAKALLDELNG